jgi:hypothetical protein
MDGKGQNFLWGEGKTFIFLLDNLSTFSLSCHAFTTHKETVHLNNSPRFHFVQFWATLTSGLLPDGGLQTLLVLVHF